MTFDEKVILFNIRSDQISCSVVSDSLQPHESQHARHPCLSPTPGVHSDSHPSSQWCHPAISIVEYNNSNKSLNLKFCLPINFEGMQMCSAVSHSVQHHGCSPPGSSAHGILQAGIVKWVVISSSRGILKVYLLKNKNRMHFSLIYYSVAQLCPTFCDPLGLQYATFPCLSPSPRACSNSCPLSRWCHTTISSSIVPFSSHLQPFPASGSFLISQLFVSGGRSIGTSATDLPVNILDWSPLGLTGLISSQPKGLSGVFSNITIQKHQSFGAQHSLRSNSHIHTWLLEKP